MGLFILTGARRRSFTEEEHFIWAVIKGIAGREAGITRVEEGGDHLFLELQTVSSG